MNWFQEHRIEWIAECLRVYGFINRAHLERKFRVSTPQASLDLKAFALKNPGAIYYDPNSKCYRAVAVAFPAEPCMRETTDG